VRAGGGINNTYPFLLPNGKVNITDLPKTNQLQARKKKMKYSVAQIPAPYPILSSGRDEITQLGEIKTHQKSTMVSYCRAQDTQQHCGQTLWLLN